MQPTIPPTEAVSPPSEPSLPMRPLELAGTALALGVAVEVLFDGQAPGISFPIWAALSAAALLIGTHWEGVRPDRSVLIFVPAILFFSAMIAVRLEPMTVALSVLSTMLLFGLWIRTLRHGRLLRFGWVDFAAAWIASCVPSRG